MLSRSRKSAPGLGPLGPGWLVKPSAMMALLAATALAIGCKPRFQPIISIETTYLQFPVVLSLADDPERRNAAAALAIAEIGRLEGQFDPLNPAGSLYQLNQQGQLSDPELYPILERAIWISELTGGGLNIFMGYLEQAYGFNNQFPRPPDANALRELMLALRRANLELLPERREVRMPNDAYAISLGAILTGYVADQTLSHLVLAGVPTARVQVGTNVAYGGSPDGTAWTHQVMHPATGQVVEHFYVEYSCVATASSIDQAYTFRDEVYYNHIDPATGLPAKTMSAVVVVAPTCELAGGLAQGVFCMEPESGLRVLNSLPEVEGLLLLPDGSTLATDSLAVWRAG